jgi:hypothetical protein
MWSKHSYAGVAGTSCQQNIKAKNGENGEKGEKGHEKGSEKGLL